MIMEERVTMAKNREIYGDTLEYRESWQWRRLVAAREPLRPWQVLEGVHPDEWTEWEVEVNPELWKTLYRYDLPFPGGAMERLKDSALDIVYKLRMPNGFKNTLKYIRNKAVMVLTAFFLAFPLCAVITGNRWMLDWSLPVMFLGMLYMSVFAALWIVVGMVPFWLLYAAVTCLVCPAPNTPMAWPVCWALAWFAYPAWRSLQHASRWEQERRSGEPGHPLYNHPYAVAATCLGTAAAMGIGSYFSGKK